MRCGVAAVEITPTVLIGMAGYSRAGKKAKGTSGRLFARSLFLEDASGRRADDVWGESLLFYDDLQSFNLLRSCGFRRLQARLILEKHMHTRFGSDPLSCHVKHDGTSREPGSPTKHFGRFL